MDTNENEISHRSPVTIALECIPKSRGLTEQELIERYNKRCDRLRVLPLWGQLKNALRVLRDGGQIAIADGLVRRIG